MTRKTKHIFMLFLVWSFAQIVCAQEPTNKNWDAQKIKGVRLVPYPSYNGSPFMTDTWCQGKIEFTTGEIADSLFMKYSSYKDELFYYNSEAASQINIDKASLKGFQFVDPNGRTRIFRKQYIDNFMKGYQFFEVLSDGPISLLAFRKSSLNTTSPYHDKSGILKNMEYVPDYHLYFYSADKGYTSVKTNRASFLSKFEKVYQKPIKKILRKSRIKIENEDSLIQGWKVIEKEGYQVLF